MAEPLLRVRDVKKTFPGVVALNGVQLEVERGEVHALLGENGAGKSTMLKILSGAHPPDAGQGTLEFDGRPLDLGDTPLRRQEIGIVTIYQEFNLLPAMSVAENMYLGREPLRNGLIDWGRMFNDARRIIDELGLELGPRTLVRSLSVAEQQMVEISKALTMNAKLIIMDEPTANLGASAIVKVRETISRLKASGVAVIIISHRLEDVFTVGDRMIVMKHGHVVGSRAVSDTATDEIVHMIVAGIDPRQSAAATDEPELS
jgi:inositol transport system ATP-binding protein